MLTTRKHMAEKCVKCAICLPACPTYALTCDENESPRGRIALMHALATDALPPSPKLAHHLDQCLQCGACEAVCPAEVPYTALLDQTHAEVAQSTPKKTKRLARFVHEVLTHAKAQTALHGFLRLTQCLKLDRIAYRLGFKHRLPPLKKMARFKPCYPAQTPRGDVILLTGCLGKTLDQTTVFSAIYVLNKLGLNVHIPTEQNCCGAIAAHYGLPEEAHVAHKNLERLLESHPKSVILSLSSGCSAHIKSLPNLAPIQDIHDFLMTQDMRALPFQPLQKSYALHRPCTAQNLLKQGQTHAQLLNHIPNLQLQVIDAPTRCCGAAGLNMFTHTDTAQTLGRQVLACAESTSITSPNIGCSLHLKTLSERHEVIHPVTLLAQSLGYPPNSPHF